MRTFLTIALAVGIAAFAAAGCKSNKCCQPQQQTACCPQPQQPAYCQPQAPGYYPPSPPTPSEAYVSQPTPAATPDVSEIQARQLDAERKGRELAEERAKRAEDALKLASTSQAPGMGGWPSPAGGGEDQSTSFAEEL